MLFLIVITETKKTLGWYSNTICNGLTEIIDYPLKLDYYIFAISLVSYL